METKTKTTRTVKLETAKDFLKFFESIPTRRWITGNYMDDSGGQLKCCAAGHLQELERKHPRTAALSYPVTDARLCGILRGLGLCNSIVSINDNVTGKGESHNMLEKWGVLKVDNPRARVCAILRIAVQNGL